MVFMKIVEVRKFGGPEVLQIIEEADAAPQAGQVAIDVKAAGVNFAEIMAREGHYPNVPSAPFRPGYEIAGVVTARGEGVEGLQEGARVMAFVPSGGYTSRIVLNAADVIPLPDALDFGQATALLVQGLTAYFLLEAGDLQPGKSVLIASAAGGVGSLAVQIAKLKGAGKVIGLASPSKHERVRSLGADVAVDYTQSGWAKQALEATAGKGIDIFLDAQGDLGSEGFDALGQKAHWLVYGGQGQRGNALPAERLGVMIGKNITLRGFSIFGDVANFKRGLTEMFGWVANGKLQIDVESFPLAEVARAQEAISNRQTSGKVVLIP
jgi:NADPH2:quinone reductase